jgi:hypothetical protein
MFEPAYHPIASIDLEFQVIKPWLRCGVGWDKWDNLDIFPVSGVDGGSGAVTEAGDIWLQCA